MILILILVGTCLWIVLAALARCVATTFCDTEVTDADIGLGPTLFARSMSGIRVTFKLLPISNSITLSRGNPSDFLVVVLAPYLAMAIFYICVHAAVHITNTKPAYLAGEPRIQNATESSWAGKVGLKEGDLILAVGRETVNSVEECLQALVGELGSTTRLLVYRDQRTLVNLTARPDLDALASPRFPFDLAFPLTNTLAMDLDGLRRGDVVSSIDGSPVTHPSELFRVIAKAPRKGAGQIEVGRGDKSIKLTAADLASKAGGTWPSLPQYISLWVAFAPQPRRIPQAMDVIGAFEASFREFLGFQSAAWSFATQWLNPFANGNRARSIRVFVFNSANTAYTSIFPGYLLFFADLFLLISLSNLVPFRLLPGVESDGHHYLVSQANEFILQKWRTPARVTVNVVSLAITLCLAFALARTFFE